MSLRHSFLHSFSPFPAGVRGSQPGVPWVPCRSRGSRNIRGIRGGSHVMDPLRSLRSHTGSPLGPIHLFRLRSMLLRALVLDALLRPLLGRLQITPTGALRQGVPVANPAWQPRQPFVLPAQGTARINRSVGYARQYALNFRVAGGWCPRIATVWVSFAVLHFDWGVTFDTAHLLSPSDY